jgi:UDP-2,3-diacylglucosamine pyrophosphatase LpxH
VPARNGAPRPWTAAEIQTAEAMRGKHTVREIAATLGRPQSSVSNLLNRPERMQAAKGRVDARQQQRDVVDRQHGFAASKSPKVNRDAVPSGISQRLDIAATPETAGRKSPAGVTTHSGASVPLEPLLLVSDAHVPYHDRKWWDLLLQVGRALRPKHIVVIGDFADFYSVSDHDKAPERANRMDDELAEVDACLDQLDALGATDKLYIEGNHEDRLRRHLMKNPALARVVSTEKLLRLKERGWEFVPYKRHAARGAVHFTHDVGAAGRNAVFRALDVYGHSVVSGHTHRFAYIVEGTATGECKLSATFGWGGDVEQIDYMNLAKARKDWALGFAVGYLDPASGFCYLVPLPVIHGTVCFNGRLFRAA